MTMTRQTTDLARIVASTLTEWINGGALQDAVFFKQGKYGLTPYLDLLTSQGSFDSAANTPEFGVQIRTGKNTNFQYYGAYETWRTTPFKGYDRAYFGSHEALMSWSIPAQEIYYNGGGATKLFDNMKEVKDTTVKSLKEQLNARLLNRDSAVVTATGTPVDEQFTDLRTIVGDELSLVKVYGERSSEDNFSWRSLIKRPGAKLPVDWKSASGYTRASDSNVISGGTYDGWQYLLLPDLRRMIDMLKDVEESGWVALTTRDIIQELETLIRAESLTVNDKLEGVLSAWNYTGVNYRGVDFVYDKNVPEGEIYFIHPSKLRFRPIAGRWMTMRDEITPHNQDALYGTIFVWGEQYSPDRGGFGKFEKVAVH